MRYVLKFHILNSLFVEGQIFVDLMTYDLCVFKGMGYPDAFAKVSYLYKWVKEHMN